MMPWFTTHRKGNSICVPTSLISAILRGAKTKIPDRRKKKKRKEEKHTPLHTITKDSSTFPSSQLQPNSLFFSTYNPSRSISHPVEVSYNCSRLQPFRHRLNFGIGREVTHNGRTLPPHHYRYCRFIDTRLFWLWLSMLLFC